MQSLQHGHGGWADGMFEVQCYTRVVMMIKLSLTYMYIAVKLGRLSGVNSTELDTYISI